MADPTNSAGFFDEGEAAELAQMRKAWMKSEREALAISVAPQTRPEASVSIQHQAGSPRYHAYRLAIPAGWQALVPVLYPVPDVPDEPARQGMPDALAKGWRQFRVGVLLCHLEAGCLAAAREFEAGHLLEAAFLGQEGQYLQAAPERPAYAVMPLAAPNSTNLGQGGSRECLVLLPLIHFPALRESQLPMMMFVDGVRVYCSIEGEAL